MSYALTHSSWENGYRIVSVTQFAITAILICTLPLWKIHHSRNAEQKNRPVVGLKQAFKIKGVPFLLTGFFGECAVEATAMLWTCSYLVETRAFTEEKAAGLVSLFFIGITGGRFVSGFFSEKLGDHNMIKIGETVAVVGILLIGLPFATDVVCIVGFLVLGIGIAPIYPSIIHSTPRNFGAENSQAIIGIQMASAYIGSTFIPPLFGILANAISLAIMPIFLLAFVALMIVMLEKTYRLTKIKENR